MNTDNPVLRSQRFQMYSRPVYGGETMTIEGTANKTAILFGLALITAFMMWYLFLVGQLNLMIVLMLVGMIGGLIVALVTFFRPQWAHATAPAYALLEGLLLGGISSIMEWVYPGIVIQAVGLTFGVFLLMLLAYRTRVLRATPAFVKGVVAATGAIFFVYLISFVLSFLGYPLSFVNGSSIWGILFSVVVVIVAALNLIIDFDLIERKTNERAPKHVEWYAAFALMVTLVWLYIEILRLLGKARRS